MTRFPIILGLLDFGWSTAAGQSSTCKVLGAEETTRHGYFERVVMEEKRPFQKVSGLVSLGSSPHPAADVFVEVFVVRDGKEKRVAGCRTGEDGTFDFPTLLNGKYTLRFSKDGGFEITDILLTVLRSAKKRSPLEASIFVGK